MPHISSARSFLLLMAMIGIGCGSETDSGGAGGSTSDAGGAAGTGGAGDAAVESSVPDAKVDQDTPETATCFPPNKLCDGDCVEPDDPDFGCFADSCSPCTAAANATVGCVNAECAIVGCGGGWANCDADPANGCETSLTTEENCGECGTGCALPNGTVSCATGSCEVENCSDGWGNCNGNSSDGCETNLRTLENCGACGVVCSIPNGSPTCVSGVCQIDG